jgi:hypothetical protein
MLLLGSICFIGLAYQYGSNIVNDTQPSISIIIDYFESLFSFILRANMKLSKSAYTYLVAIVVCLCAIILEIRTLFGGKFVNLLVPCKQIETNSAPCYVVYDFTWLVILGLILIVFVVLFVHRLNRAAAKKAKK